MNGFHPPLADLDELIPFLIMIIFFVVGAISQALNKLRQAQQPPPPPRPQARPPQPVAPNERRQGPLAQEIDEFLRRAGQGRPAPPAPSAPSAAPFKPVQAQVVERQTEQPEEPSRLSERHLGHLESRLAPSALGKEVVSAQDRLQQHFHQVFEHRVGTLTSGELTAEAPQSEASEPSALTVMTPADLVAMLSTPAGMRQAVVLNEILQRPEHRW